MPVPVSDSEAGCSPVVLVVEDEILIRLDLAAILRDGGYRVHEAADADEALALMAAVGPIDLVITDVRMPGERDGLALAREIRARWPDLPVVLASAHWQGDMAPMADRLLAKPYMTAEILITARELTERAWLAKMHKRRAS